MMIALLGPRAQAIAFHVRVERGFPLKEKDVLSAFQSQKSWFWTSDVSEENIIPLCVQHLETLKRLVEGRSLSYINVKQYLKAFLFKSTYSLVHLPS